MAGTRPLETDMMGQVYLSYTIGWEKFLGWIFSPRSEAVYEDGWSNIIPVRMVQPFIFKILYTFFQDNHSAYLIYRLIVMVILAVLLYAIAYRITQDKALSFLCALFVVANPGSSASMVELWDTETLGEMFMIGALICFLRLTQPLFAGEEESGRWRSFLMTLALFYLLGNLAVKTKDTEKLMLPGILCVFLFFTMIFQRFFGTSKMKWDLRLSLLLAACLLICLPLVWIKRVGIAPVEYHPWDILKILFWNPQGWEQESLPQLIRLRRHLPTSVLGSFGFLLSWAAVLLVFSVCGRVLQRAREGSAAEPRRIFLLLGLWLLFCLPIFVVRPGLHLPRYLILPLIPCSLIFVYAVKLALEGHPLAFAKAGKWLIVLLLAVQVADNARHSLYFRNELPAIWIKQYKVREEVFKDLTGQSTVTPLMLDRYFVDANYPIRAMDYLYPHERKDPLAEPAFVELLRQHKTLYAASTNPLPDHSNCVLIRQMDALGVDLYSRLMKKFSKSGGEQIYLYRITGE